MIPWQSLKLAAVVVALLVSGSTVAAAPPAHALPPVPHPPIHPPPSRPPVIHPGPALDDIVIPEPRPSNDPNFYEPLEANVPPGAVQGTSQYVGDGDGADDGGGGLNLKSLGLAGGVLVSVTSLVMWLRRRT